MHRRALVAAVLAFNAAAVALPSSAAAFHDDPIGFDSWYEVLPGGATSAAMGDVTGDDLDDGVRLQRRGADGWRVVVSSFHLGRSSASPRTVATGGLGDLALGDLDGDGDLDALVALTGTYRHALHLNDLADGGTGAFGAGALSPRADGEPATGAVLRLADADGDGDLDALRLDPASGTLALLRNDGTGTFATATTLATVAGARTLAVGDLTADGRADAAVGTADGVVVVRNDGTGGVAGETAYAAGPDAYPLVADVTGDGANDLVAATGDAVVAYAAPAFAAPVTLLSYGASRLVESNGYLAGLTEHGPFLATRTGTTYAARHVAQPGLTSLAVGTIDRDGLPDLLGAGDSDGWMWFAQEYPSLANTGSYAVVGTGQTVRLVADVRNSPVPVDVTWLAARGTVDGARWTAPSSARPEGTRVRLQGTVAGSGLPVYATVDVRNERLGRVGLAGREVRGFGWRAGLAEPYYATDAGVHARVPGSSPAAYAPVGTTALTGTDAREVVVPAAGVLVARFGASLFRHTGTGDWAPTGPTGVTSLAAFPSSSEVYAAAGGQVWRGTDGGATWTALGGSDVVDVTVSRHTVWAVTADRAVRRAPSSGTFALTDVMPPAPGATVESLATVEAGDAVDAVFAHDDGAYRWDDGRWRRTHVPAGMTLAASSDSDQYVPSLALRSGTRDVHSGGAQTYDAGTGGRQLWFPLGSGLAPGAAALSGWHGTGAAYVGTNDGVYRRVDPTPPAAPSLTAAPADTVGPQGPFTFAFGTSPGEPGLTYLCTLRATSAPCTSPVTYAAPLAEGAYDFAVVAIDADGNESGETRATFTVDATPPAAPALLSVPAARTRSRSATFGFDAPSATCALDGAAPVACESGVTFDGLGDGPHTLDVRALDEVGNASDPATHSWTVDTAPPAVPSIGTAPPALTRATSAAFAFDAPGSSSTTCSLDGATPVACASGVVYASLGDGPHTFAVRALDDLGNASEPATHAWTVDTAAPAAPSLSSAPPARAGTAAATFAWDAVSGAGHYRCSLDGAEATACPSGIAYASLAEGPHTFAVSAVDLAGNVSEAATHAWTVDLTPPDGPVLTSAPPPLTASTSASFAWQPDAGVGHYTCELDGVAVPCAGPYAVGHGPHTFSVVAHALNDHATPASHSWTVDAVAPVATIATPPASLTPRITVTLDEPGTVALTLRTGTAAVASTATATSLTPVAPLVPGQLYTVSATATDALGNVAAPVTRTFRAPGAQQEDGVATRAAWRRVPWNGAQGGSFSTSHVAGASATFAFTGTSVTWYSVRGPAYGLADVYVDGVLKASKVNLYAPSVSAVTRTFGGLANGPHTVRVVARGQRGAASATGAEVAVDAFKVGTVLHASPAATWTWARPAAAGASGGAYAIEDAAGATFAMTFRGRAVDWVTVLGPGMGLARVSVDGVSKGTFDNYAATLRYGAVRTFGGLSDGVHTVTVTVLGQRRAGATGSLVAVDRLDARP